MYSLLSSSRREAISLFIIASSAAASTCDCYMTNGSVPTYYTNYQSWDFRYLSQYAGVPNEINTVDGNTNAPVTSDYFASGGDFSSFWAIQTWSTSGGPVQMVNSNNNVYIQSNNDGSSDTFLTLRTYRESGFQSTAELQSISTVNYASMRMYAKTVGSDGACTSMFTYLTDDQESDIEILTSGPDTVIQYTNQPGQTPGATSNATMPGGLNWQDWVTHRLDWTPGTTIWSVDGTEVVSQTLQTPDQPSYLLFQAWSDGGSWTGEMPVDQEAELDIQWFDILFGVTDASSCSNVCSVEDSDVGNPVPV